jgi:hypothetical protein
MIMHVTMTLVPGLPDGFFQTSFGTFWKAFEWKILISFVSIWLYVVAI